MTKKMWPGSAGGDTPQENVTAQPGSQQQTSTSPPSTSVTQTNQVTSPTTVTQPSIKSGDISVSNSSSSPQPISGEDGGNNGGQPITTQATVASEATGTEQIYFVCFFTLKIPLLTNENVFLST